MARDRESILASMLIIIRIIGVKRVGGAAI
jgi:hypothetical protein